MSGIRPPNYSKLTINWKNDNDITICWHDVIVKFFWRCFVSLAKFSYWSKFYVNFIPGSGVMTIFLHTGLTKNPEIGNTPVWVLLNIWRLGQARNTKFSTNVSNEMLFNAAKFQGYFEMWFSTIYLYCTILILIYDVLSSFTSYTIFNLRKL